jgi:hydroxymethylpyrimidine/phosphomethylpyrimidine kinase
MQTVLTIAGFDPSSGAGITADLMVFAAHGLFGTSAITALTVQSTTGVRSTHPVSAEILSKTLDCLRVDLPPAGVKIGMLGTSANVRSVARYLGELRQLNPHINIVLDPVLTSSSGRELLDSAGVRVLRKSLLPCIDWITPNLDELSVLTGAQVRHREEIPNACRALQQQVSTGTLGIFATGGHLDPPDDFLLTPTGEELWLPGTRVETRATHGTGCALSSAFLSRLVLGDAPAEAARAAKSYVTFALQTAIPRGTGHSGINHLWNLDNPKR